MGGVGGYRENVRNYQLYFIRRSRLVEFTCRAKICKICKKKKPEKRYAESNETLKSSTRLDSLTVKKKKNPLKSTNRWRV